MLQHLEMTLEYWVRSVIFLFDKTMKCYHQFLGGDNIYMNQFIYFLIITKIEYTKVRNFTQQVLLKRYVKATGTPLQCMLSKH